jgi:hypothetical protein
MQYGYRDIIDYFEAMAITSSDFRHTISGRVTFMSSDISDYLAEEIGNLASPFMIAGFAVEGVDNGKSIYTYSEVLKSKKNYNFNLGVFSESELDTDRAVKETLCVVDELCDKVIKKVFEDRMEAIDTDVDNLCFLKYIDMNVTISEPVIIGTRKAIGQVLNFNFNFCR